MRLGARQRKQQGDTIIEVIFAVVIFSFIAISSIMIMNKGIATGERALEITLVRQQINAQAEALRYIHEARVVTPELATEEGSLAHTWSRFLSSDSDGFRQAQASMYGLDEEGTCSIPAGSFKPFVLNAHTAQIWPGTITTESTAGREYPPYPQVAYSDDSSVIAAYGMWVESVPSSTLVARRFIDFHIRACWDAPGTSMPMTIGTIVRLYDPAS